MLKKALEDQLLEVKEREEEAAELEKKEYELIKEKIALEDAVRAKPSSSERECQGAAKNEVILTRTCIRKRV